MSKTIHLPHVPDRLHGDLVRRARNRAISLSDYIQEILAREVTRPPAEEVFERIARRSRVDLGRSAAEILRGERKAGATR